jgi:hypothetical protein
MELRGAFQEAGLTVNRHILRCLVLRYGKCTRGEKGEIINVERVLSFDDFVHCCIKLKCSIDSWNAMSKIKAPAPEFPGFRGFGRRNSNVTRPEPETSFTLNEWVERVMYS